jgi:hypothetical protein
VPIALERGVGAQTSVGMLFSKITTIVLQTHFGGGEDEDENNGRITGMTWGFCCANLPGIKSSWTGERRDRVRST